MSLGIGERPRPTDMGQVRFVGGAGGAADGPCREIRASTGPESLGKGELLKEMRRTLERDFIPCSAYPGGLAGSYAKNLGR